MKDLESLTSVYNPACFTCFKMMNSLVKSNQLRD